jgi:hypothetical protein
VIEWRRVPWTLWALAALWLVGVILIEVEIHGQVPSKVLFPFVMFAWLFFLLKGVRWLWIATVVIVVLGFINSLATGPRTWYGIAAGLIGLGLLLLPATRCFFASEPVTADT